MPIRSQLKDCICNLKFLIFLKAGSTAPLFIDQPEEPESNVTDGIELFEDSQLTSRSKAIASKTKEIEQVRIQPSLST